ncbi:acetate--CoA ligase family protein [Sphingomonas sp. MMS24-JH45]
MALKILSPDILHKSDIGGVALDLRARTPCVPPRRRCWRAVPRPHPRRRSAQLLAAPMAAPGVELLVGLIDPPSARW